MYPVRLRMSLPGRSAGKGGLGAGERGGATGHGEAFCRSGIRTRIHQTSEGFLADGTFVIERSRPGRAWSGRRRERHRRMGIQHRGDIVGSGRKKVTLRHVAG